MEEVRIEEPDQSAEGEPIPLGFEERVQKVAGFAGEMLTVPVNPAYFDRDPATGYARKVQAGL